jgi:hypothetical protein
MMMRAREKVSDRQHDQLCSIGGASHPKLSFTGSRKRSPVTEIVYQA